MILMPPQSKLYFQFGPGIYVLKNSHSSDYPMNIDAWGDNDFWFWWESTR